MIISKYKKQNLYGQRTIRRRQKLKHQRNEQLYCMFEGTFDARDRSTESDLVGIELVIKDHLEKLIESKQSTDRTVIYFDFGGGFGASTLRIANFFRRQIEEGKIIFNVSNLEFVPTQEDIKLYKNNGWVLQKQADFIRDHMHLAHYIELPRTYVRGSSIKNLLLIFVLWIKTVKAIAEKDEKTKTTIVTEKKFLLRQMVRR